MTQRDTHPLACASLSTLGIHAMDCLVAVLRISTMHERMVLCMVILMVMVCSMITPG